MEQHGGPTRVSTEPTGTTGRQGHSRMGIASFVLALLATALVVMGAVVAVGLVGQFSGGANPQAVAPEEVQRTLEGSPGALAAIGVGLLGGPLLYLIGLGLGIAGLIQRPRKRLFAILGTVFNGLPFLAIVGIFVLGAIGATLGAA